MSYDEHLISMAGGDGETDLDAIQALFGSIAFPDTPEERDAAERKILALVRDQQAKLDRILKLADWAGHRGWHIAPATLRNTINEARK